MQNKNNELISKLEREIWLFEQWLAGIEGETDDTHQRIRDAYRECIRVRIEQLQHLREPHLASA